MSAPKIPPLTAVKPSPSAYAVFPTTHHLLFVLLPLALAARMVLKPRPSTLDVAQGVTRFCLGFGKWALLVDPLWHLSSMVMHGGTDSLSTGVAWMGFLARLLSLQFAFTSAGDLIAGFSGMMGFKVADKAQSILDLRFLTHGKLIWLLPLLILLTVLSLSADAASLSDAWLHLRALFTPPTKTISTVFQEARVWSDYHTVTMVAALACFFGLPYSRDFLRTPAFWKGAICLGVFFLAMAMLWTHSPSA